MRQRKKTRQVNEKPAPKGAKRTGRNAAKRRSPMTSRVRYAVVGQGYIAQAAVLPAPGATARHLFGAEPIEVVTFAGNDGEDRFREVDEMTSAILRFPDERIASFTCSFGAADVSRFELVGTKGTLEMDKAYEFAEDITQRVTIGERTSEQEFPARDQFAPELLYFSDCIQGGLRPEPSGQEGWADVRIIRALLKSIDTHRPVTLQPFDRRRQPDPEQQEIHRPPVEEPDLVGATSPSGKE